MSTDDLDTKPTITTLLERINELGESLRKHIDEAAAETRKYIDDAAAEIRAEIVTLRTDTNRNFRSLERRFAVLSGDMIKLRADLHDLEDSVAGIEQKPV